MFPFDTQSQCVRDKPLRGGVCFEIYLMMWIKLRGLRGSTYYSQLDGGIFVLVKRLKFVGRFLYCGDIELIVSVDDFKLKFLIGQILQPFATTFAGSTLEFYKDNIIEKLLPFLSWPLLL